METQEQEVSIDDTMAAVFDQMNEEAPKEELQQEAPDEDTDEPVEASEDAVEDPAETESEDTQEESVEAPASWTAEAKEQFAKLPKETQEYIAERETHREKAINEAKAELADVKKQVSGYQSVTDKYGQYFSHYNLDPVATFDALVQAEYTLRNGTPEQKIQMFSQIAQDYGIDISGGEIDPNSQVAQLSQKLADVENRLKSITDEQQNKSLQEAEQLIASFKSAKDENGNLEHPYYEEVRETMAKLMNAGLGKDLEDIYRQAIKLVPEVAQKIEAENRRKSEKEAVERAKKAKTGASVKSQGVPKDMIAKSESLDETLERIYDQIN